MRFFLSLSFQVNTRIRTVNNPIKFNVWHLNSQMRSLALRGHFVSYAQRSRNEFFSSGIRNTSQIQCEHSTFYLRSIYVVWSFDWNWFFSFIHNKKRFFFFTLKWCLKLWFSLSPSLCNGRFGPDGSWVFMNDSFFFSNFPVKCRLR